jgi:hypothetical protein
MRIQDKAAICVRNQEDDLNVPDDAVMNACDLCGTQLIGAYVESSGPMWRNPAHHIGTLLIIQNFY